MLYCMLPNCFGHAFSFRNDFFILISPFVMNHQSESHLNLIFNVCSQRRRVLEERTAGERCRFKSEKGNAVIGQVDEVKSDGTSESLRLVMLI